MIESGQLFLWKKFECCVKHMDRDSIVKGKKNVCPKTLLAALVGLLHKSYLNYWLVVHYYYSTADLLLNMAFNSINEVQREYLFQYFLYLITANEPW